MNKLWLFWYRAVEIIIMMILSNFIYIEHLKKQKIHRTVTESMQTEGNKPWNHFHMWSQFIQYTVGQWAGGPGVQRPLCLSRVLTGVQVTVTSTCVNSVITDAFASCCRDSKCKEFWELFTTAFVGKDREHIPLQAYDKLIEQKPIPVNHKKVLSNPVLHSCVSGCWTLGCTVICTLLSLFRFCCGAELVTWSKSWKTKNIISTSGRPSMEAWAQRKSGVERKGVRVI